MEIMIFCGIYLVELVCYQLGLRLLFGLHVNISKWILIGIVMPVAIWNFPINISGKNVLVSLCVVFIMYLSMEGKVTEKGFRLGLVHLFLECMDGICAFSYEKMLFSESKYIRSLEYLCVKACIVFCIICLIHIKNKNYKNAKIHISSIIYLLLGIVVISMMVCLALLNQLSNYLPNNKYIVFCNVVEYFNHISILLLIILVLYIKRTHENMEKLLKLERLLKESQVTYYKEALKKEADTRKYRHDMMNHLIYLHDILSRNKIDEAEDYLSNILDGFQNIQKTYYVIGNEMIDTIMNYFFSYLPKNIEIKINGKCPVEIDLLDIDICAIFSNIFQNAVEEIVENNLIDAEIFIDVNKGRQYVEYIIKNTLSKNIDQEFIDKNGLPRTQKMDKRVHGIGLINTTETVKRNGGKFGWYQTDGYFCVNVILPIK